MAGVERVTAVSCGHLCASHQHGQEVNQQPLGSDATVLVPRSCHSHPRKVSKLHMCCRHSKGPGGRGGHRADNPGVATGHRREEAGASTAESRRDLDQRLAAAPPWGGPGGSCGDSRGGAPPKETL